MRTVYTRNSSPRLGYDNNGTAKKAQARDLEHRLKGFVLALDTSNRRSDLSVSTIYANPADLVKEI